MRDDRMKWAALPETFLTVRREAVLLTLCDLERQYLVSAVDAATHRGAFGWPEIAKGPSYRLRISRDQSLVVGGAEHSVGWQADRAQAVTDMSDGYQVFEVSGPGAFDVLCRGAELDLQTPSPSVARGLWGIAALLYRHGGDDTFRLHVARSYAMALYAALVTAMDQYDQNG